MRRRIEYARTRRSARFKIRTFEPKNQAKRELAHLSRSKKKAWNFTAEKSARVKELGKMVP